MRVRDKRKLPKEHKSPKSGDKQKAMDDEATPTSLDNSQTTTAIGTTTTSTTTTTAKLQPTLPATEKVAFDNRIKRKNVLALNEKVAALREYERQPVYKHVGRLFNCSPDQIKRIVLQKKEILSAWEQRTRRSQDAKTQELKVVRVSMLGKAVYDWIRRMMYYKDFIITDGLIQKMALQFKSSMGLSNFFPDQEWCDKFRTTYNIIHNDTKLLNFGYVDSHSVQINDIAKDIMSACNRAAVAAEVAADTADIDIGDDDDDLEAGGSLATISSSSRAGADEDDGDVDIDGGGTDHETDELPDVKPSVTELNQHLLQPLPQLVRLPHVPTGSTQRVLLATPILPPGATPSGAQTMTIIPLATLSQSITQRPALQPKPLPMPLDIKQEIKTEPKDSEEEQVEEKDKEQQPVQMEEQQKVQMEEQQQVREPIPVEVVQMASLQEKEQPQITIKKELDSDEDELFVDDFDDDTGGRSSVTSLAEILAANVDDEKQYIEHTRALRHHKRSLSPRLTTTTPTSQLPPMPTLIKASSPPKRQRQHDDNNNAGIGVARMPIKISCAEARKYLKLLEEFALSKENYRLIELITRADEVMRELADE